jgi:hypothetical protein
MSGERARLDLLFYCSHVGSITRLDRDERRLEAAQGERRLADLDRDRAARQAALEHADAFARHEAEFHQAARHVDAAIAAADRVRREVDHGGALAGLEGCRAWSG